MGGHRHFGCSSPETIPIETLTVTGDGDPSPNGLYLRLPGLYNNQKFYRRDDTAYSIWWSETWGEWGISVVLDESGDYWYRSGVANILGEYTPHDGFTGNPIVS